MSKLKGYVPNSLLTAMAAIIALAIAWEPGPAETDTAGAEAQIASMSAGCEDAAWPYVSGDCLIYEDANEPSSPVRRILIDDNTRVERRAEFALLQ